MGRAPLELVVAVKGLAHWLTNGLPLIVAAPLTGLFLNIDPAAEAALTLTLLVGTPALTFIGLIGAAIAVTLRRGGQFGGDGLGPIRHPLYDSVRADADEPGGRTVCRRRRAAAGNGIT